MSCLLLYTCRQGVHLIASDGRRVFSLHRSIGTLLAAFASELRRNDKTHPQLSGCEICWALRLCCACIHATTLIVKEAQGQHVSCV